MQAPSRGVWAACAVALAGCGSAASLSNLRCDASCQDVADPFLMNLAVTFDDPAAVLARSDLVVQINGASAATYKLETLIVPKGATAGTLRFPLSLHFRSVTDGETFELGVQSSGPDGTSNLVRRTFVIHQ